MLKIRVVKGPNVGQIFNLGQGENTVGRIAPSQIILGSNGVSKSHAKILVQGDQCVVTDSNSSNGTFVNGTKVKDRILRVGDKIAFHDVIVELVNEQGGEAHIPQIPNQIPGGQQFWGENVAFQQQPNGFPAPGNQPHMQGLQSPGQPQHQAQESHSALNLVKTYVEKVILPGIYYLAEIYPLKNVLGAFILAFVILVTSLSSIPMAELTKDGIQKESMRRAMTIARQLAAISERAMASGGEANVRTDFAENEDGVQSALVISKEDGHIIAPVTRQEYSNDQYVARAKKYDKESAESLGGNLIGAAAPIRSFNSESGGQLISAMAVVIYKMDTVDWSATTAVFARVLLIALVLGSVVYFLIYKMIIHPINQATQQLDEALRGDRDVLDFKVNFEPFEKLVSNMNSAVSRMGQANAQNIIPADRNGEASNLVRIVNEPAFALDNNLKFLEVNEAFGDLTGMRLLSLQGQGLEALSDQALKLQLEDLVLKAKSSMSSIIQGELEISGVIHDIYIMASADAQNALELSYVFGTIKRRNQA